MIGWIVKFLKSERASVLPTLAITLPVVMGMTALGTDGSFYVMKKSDLQTAADAAAYAAAWEMSQGSEDNMNYMAGLEAERNGFNPGEGSLNVEAVTQLDGQISVQATIIQDAPLFFFKALFAQPFKIHVNSESLVSNDYLGNYCILSLEEEESGAFKTVGTVEIQATSCGLA
ncbi:MAG: pilus assembly protein TadG-related protein, partial [Pseudobdellovibrionaceae bacterium]|nr:pilus assembly protein TadG-related protein [Pseudobdellovibrionaceae bacterium]